MIATRNFLDSNVLLYLQSGDAAKADRAEQLALSGGVISVQVLNEMTHVMQRKLGRPWSQIHEVMTVLQRVFVVEALTLAVHETGRRLAQRYRLNLFDAMIAASALLAGCELLYSEDMHDGLVVEDRLRIVNPFSSAMG